MAGAKPGLIHVNTASSRRSYLSLGLQSVDAMTRASQSTPAQPTVETAADVNAAPARQIGIKHVLACVDGTENDRSVLDHALQVAQRLDSHIDVLHVRFDADGATTDPERKRHADRFFSTPLMAIAADTAHRARAHFDAWHERSKLPLRDSATAVRGPSACWREIVGYESEIVAQLGRLSDLIVIARPNQHSTIVSVMALETALFETGRPVLMVPDRPAANLFYRPLVAWNGSIEAARALAFALPLLAECDGPIDVFIAPERKHATDTGELLRYLSWHGIAADRTSAGDTHDVGVSLLAQASARQAGLVVMGAYTHGHFRQFVFGGATRHVMQHAATPVLLAH
jgi:nucleotide-binding universal stress UspA family protein